MEQYEANVLRLQKPLNRHEQLSTTVRVLSFLRTMVAGMILDMWSIGQDDIMDQIQILRYLRIRYDSMVWEDSNGIQPKHQNESIIGQIGIRRWQNYEIPE